MRSTELNLRTLAITGLLVLAAPLANAAGSPAAPITEKSFKCITDMTPVRHFYVDNLNGDLKETVRVAQSTRGEPYPVGSVLQLVPTEVMVKREKGFNATTKDWEFFELDLTKTGSTIRTRGFTEVSNRFGGNCLNCHVKARPEWDLVCDITHGCDPIPITRAMSGALQRTDPRCEHKTPLSDEDAAALTQLGAIVKAINAAKPPAQ
jgi:hypothetical protein